MRMRCYPKRVREKATRTWFAPFFDFCTFSPNLYSMRSRETCSDPLYSASCHPTRQYAGWRRSWPPGFLMRNEECGRPKPSTTLSHETWGGTSGSKGKWRLANQRVKEEKK